MNKSANQIEIFDTAVAFLAGMMIIPAVFTFMGTEGMVLDILDYISNYVRMPVVSIATCVFIGWVIQPKVIIKEVTRNGEKFGREKLYVVMIKFVTPVLLMILLQQALGILKL